MQYTYYFKFNKLIWMPCSFIRVSFEILKIITERRMSSKNVFHQSHKLRMHHMQYMTHYSDKRVHSATICLQQRDTGSLLFCQQSGCTIHPSEKN